ncbi:MAG TPA: hypothetical protein PKM73_13340 [Verrucomicrobiota bacterium]|nr:hypothetical protein [Verrucomicrobiota bacterium]HNU52196.1 hypothetical protein [Verrucomicrobiota bacterium]
MNAFEDRARARRVLERMPEGGLFAGHRWRTSPAAFPIDPAVAADLDRLGAVLLRFYQAADRLYRESAAGSRFPWVASVLDRGKPDWLVAMQRTPALRGQVPRVIRPDLLLTDTGMALTELDSLPGGIGLTAWLNEVYAPWEPGLVGGPHGMLDGFQSLFADASRIHIVVSEEAQTYRPEMEWLCRSLAGHTHTPVTCQVQDGNARDIRDGDAVYRFFELFDVDHVPCARDLLDRACRGAIRLTPPPKPLFEEKILLGLLWNPRLQAWWRGELGDTTLETLLRVVPYTWIVDPAPVPPHGVIPELELTDWRQLKTLSQRGRELVLKVSGFSPQSHSSHGVSLGNDLSAEAWGTAVDAAIQGFDESPRVLQRYRKPREVRVSWYDPGADTLIPLAGRVRLCPYYFVAGDGAAAQARLGGCLATVCPADKKIIHGMSVAILAPTATSPTASA